MTMLCNTCRRSLSTATHLEAGQLVVGVVKGVLAVLRHLIQHNVVNSQRMAPQTASLWQKRTTQSGKQRGTVYERLQSL